MPHPAQPEPARTRAVYSTALRTRFRGLTRRDGVLLRGAAGWGEFSPFWDYDDAVSAPWLAAALEAADLGLPEPLRERVPVNVTVPAVGPERAAEIVRASGGCTTAKVKVAEPGQTAAEEIDRVAAVREALGPAGQIRVDANAAWDVDTAVLRLRDLDRAAGGLQYAEQPVPGVEDLAALRRRTHVRLAADESVRRAEDPLRVARARAADVLVLKVQPLGGVRACLRLAEEAGLPVVVSSALESSVGLAAGVALAAALPLHELDGVPLAAGLATGHLLERDVTTAPLLPTDGHLPVRTVEPDAVPPADADTERRWLDRLEAVAARAGGRADAAPPVAIDRDSVRRDAAVPTGTAARGMR